MKKILYSYSKLFLLGFKRKEYSLVKTADGLYATNNSKNTMFAVLFTFIISMWIVVVSFILLQALISTNTDISIFFIVPFAYGIGVMGLRQFLWLINGSQELSIEDGYLILKKRGTFCTQEKRYELDDISKIRAAFFEEDLSTEEQIQVTARLVPKTLFSQTIGAVLFTYKFDTIKVFNELNSDEKRELIAAIKEIQEKAS
jgi:hypothetical protein